MSERRKLGGKRPARLRAAGGTLTVRERIWTALRRQSRPFTKAAIALAAEAHRDAVRSYFEQLLKGGYLRAVGRAPRPGKRYGEKRRNWWRAMRYELARDVGIEAPRLRRDGSLATLGRGREQLWRAVKILREFDARELQAAAGTAEYPVALLSAKAYILQLARGGYLVLSRRGRNGVYSRYRFIPAMNTGPRSPIARKSGAVFDPNLGRVMWQP